MLPVAEESHFVEKPWRLPDSYLCFTPPQDDAKVGALPMLASAFIWTAPFCVALGLILVLLLVETVDEFYALWGWLARRPIGLRWGFYYALLASLAVLGQWGMSKFVYMQF